MAHIMAEKATFARADGNVVLRDLTWTWNEGESWAIVGDTASGKTSFLEAMLGRMRLVSGSLLTAIHCAT